jgi:hypothetical protein
LRSQWSLTYQEVSAIIEYSGLIPLRLKFQGCDIVIRWKGTYIMRESAPYIVKVEGRLGMYRQLEQKQEENELRAVAMNQPLDLIWAV